MNAMHGMKTMSGSSVQPGKDAEQGRGVPTEAFDIVVLGSGAAGLGAAVVAASNGLKVLVLEKTDSIGGTTAISGGACWLPGSRHAAAVGRPDDAATVKTYLRQFLGNRFNEKMIDAFLAVSPEVVDFYESRTELKFAARAMSPDYRPQLEGGSLGGRVLDPLAFDGRLLGKDLKRLRKPLPEYTAFNGMMVNKADANAFLSSHKSLKSFIHSSKLMSRYVMDRLFHGRGTRLLLGAALIGRLLRTAQGLGVPVLTDAKVEDLMQDENGRVAGVRYAYGGRMHHAIAHRGVVLATGGIPGNLKMKAHLVPFAEQHLSVPPATNDGGGLQLAQSAGGWLNEDGVNQYFFSPVSTRVRADGTHAVFPHLVLDRQKPGLIAVNAEGRRFVNESDSYHDFVEGMHRANAVPAFLICDHAFIRKYGMGMVQPGPRLLGPYIKSGYLLAGRTVEDLAAKIGADPVNLRDEVSRNNRFAQTGVDEDFGRGSTAYNRFLGDEAHKPNPCIGPIGRAPFYAIKIYPGDIGSSAGITVNENTQVVTRDGQAVEGLYACGNDIHSIFAGTYPGPGTTLGPGLAFGYIAVKHMMDNQVATSHPTLSR